MHYLLPTPDKKGIDEIKKLYARRNQIVLSDEQAEDVLGRLMRFTFLLSELNSKEQPTTKADVSSNTC